MFQGFCFENTGVKHRFEVTTEGCFLLQSLHRNCGFSSKVFINGT